VMTAQRGSCAGSFPMSSAMSFVPLGFFPPDHAAGAPSREIMAQAFEFAQGPCKSLPQPSFRTHPAALEAP
jgi:hypothetical protein